MKTSLMHTALNPCPVSAMPASRNLLLRVGVAFSLLFALCGPASVASAQKAIPAYGKLPLSFEPNRGQTDAQVQFLSRGPGYALFLSPQEAVLSLQTNKPSDKRNANGLPVAAPAKTSTLRMQILGANTAAVAEGQQILLGTANYFEGTDQSQWKTAIPTFQRVSYTAIYPGVDLVYYGNQRELEYDFVVYPGADPNRITLGFQGATPRVESKSGDLVLATSGAQTRFHKPVVYQLEGTRRTPIAGSYTIANNQVHFALGTYDKSKILVIDPILSYVTYIGGSSNNLINGMAIDSAGSTYIVATTQSTDYPTKNPYQSISPGIAAYQGRSSMVVSKLNATGTALIYSTYLGSTESTEGLGIAVDTGGNAYVVGDTTYGTYPITPGAFQTICGGNYVVPPGSLVGVRASGCVGAGQGDTGGVLTKLNPTGTALAYSTYLSGNNYNTLRAVAVNAAGEAYVTGVTNAYCPAPPYNANGTGYQAYSCFPVTTNAADSSVAQGGDIHGFLTKFNSSGTGLVYSTLLSNHNTVNHYSSQLHSNAIALDAAGNAYITGYMDTNYFIAPTPGAFQSTPTVNAQPAFVAKYNPAGTSATSLVYATYLSGTTTGIDVATGIAVDASGNAIVTGHTSSCTFPTTAGSFNPVPGGYLSQNFCSGGFLTKLNAAGSGLVWSTFTGTAVSGYYSDFNDAVALGPDGSVYVAGDQNGGTLSPTVNPIFPQNESHFTYIKHFTADGANVTFSSAIGGTTDAGSIPTSIVVDAANNIYLAGYTNSFTWPVTAGAFQATNKTPNGNYDTGYMVKLAPTATTTTALTLPTGTVIAGQSVKLTAKVTGQTGSTGTPTGTITFLSGTSTLGTGALDATGTASYTAASLNATTYMITASYPGDTTFAASVSAVQNLVVAPATPMVTLTAPATALVGASVTLAVSVTGTGGTPTGMVTFKDGITTLSTVALASGAASYSTLSLAAGAHSITASYGGDSLFAAAVSATSTVTINVAPAISFASVVTSLTIVRGGSGSLVITGTPVGGYTGAATFACGTLPTAVTCVFAPASLSFTGSSTAQSTTLTIATITTGALEFPTFGRSAPGIFVAFLLPLGFLLRNRRKGVLKGLLILVVTIASISVAGLSGCTGSNSVKAPTTITTPAGSYSIPVNISASGGNTTLNIPVTVQ